MEVVDMHFLEDERGQKFLNTRTCTEIHEIDKYFNALRTNQYNMKFETPVHGTDSHLVIKTKTVGSNLFRF